jgi:hypothetical protein
VRFDGAPGRLRGARRAAELLDELGLTPDGIAARARSLVGKPLRKLLETA